MSKNRRTSKKMSVNATVATNVGSLLAALFVMVIVNFLASSSCQQLSKAIGDNRKELARLDRERSREMTNWEAMKTPEKVKEALLKHGLAMNPPRADQNVYMGPDGKPSRGQYSVNAARRRHGGVAAQYKKAR